MNRDRIGGVLIACMAATTMLGSVSGLIHFAEKGAPGVLTIGDLNIPVGTLAFVAGLDGLAVALTVLAHRNERTDWGAFVGLLAATAASTALQVAAVWGNAEAVIVHGLPAPCTAIAAFYWLRSLGHAQNEVPPPPAEVHAPGDINADVSASGLAETGPPPAPEVPPAPAGPEQRRKAKQGTGRAGGRAAASKLQGDELLRSVALRLLDREEPLTVRNVDAAVKAVRGSCGRALRDEVYAALSEPDALTIWAETSATGDAKEND